MAQVSQDYTIEYNEETKHLKVVSKLGNNTHILDGIEPFDLSPYIGLKSLKFRGCRKVIGFENVVPSIEKAKLILSVGDYPWIKDIKNVSLVNTECAHKYLGNQDKVYIFGLHKLDKYYENLRTIPDITLEGLQIQTAKGLGHAERLTLIDCGYLQSIKDLATVKHLVLRGCCDIWETDFEYLGSQETLEITGMYTTDDFVELVERLIETMPNGSFIYDKNYDDNEHPYQDQIDMYGKYYYPYEEESEEKSEEKSEEEEDSEEEKEEDSEEKEEEPDL